LLTELARQDSRLSAYSNATPTPMRGPFATSSSGGDQLTRQLLWIVAAFVTLVESTQASIAADVLLRARKRVDEDQAVSLQRRALEAVA
jgi:hypothetical protein